MRNQMRCNGLTKRIMIGLLESIADHESITKQEAYALFAKKKIPKRGDALNYHWYRLQDNGFIYTLNHLLDMRTKLFKITPKGKKWLELNKNES